MALPERRSMVVCDAHADLVEAVLSLGHEVHTTGHLVDTLADTVADSTRNLEGVREDLGELMSIKGPLADVRERLLKVERVQTPENGIAALKQYRMSFPTQAWLLLGALALVLVLAGVAVGGLLGRERSADMIDAAIRRGTAAQSTRPDHRRPGTATAPTPTDTARDGGP